MFSVVFQKKEAMYGVYSFCTAVRYASKLSALNFEEYSLTILTNEAALSTFQTGCHTTVRRRSESLRLIGSAMFGATFNMVIRVGPP